MRPLSELTPAEALAIDHFVFDLDDTLLDDGALGERAYASLFRLREAGIQLVACTGRPAGWAEIVARQWPIEQAIAENGAVAWQRNGAGRVVLWDPAPAGERAERRRRLLALRDEILRGLPEMTLADDNGGRITDITFDIGEHRRVDPPIVDSARALAIAAGVETFTSSVHFHITLDKTDKAAGFIAAGAALAGNGRSFARAGFAGDSSNDAAAFAAFGVSFGVANVRRHLHALPMPPTFVSDGEMGAGFAEIAEAIVAKRR
ncbi:MAG: HAD hydrolase family protein [Myxococcales bacterium]|nr:HAD hydrolase family protein [Myxococcales bacterium]